MSGGLMATAAALVAVPLLNPAAAQATNGVCPGTTDGNGHCYAIASFGTSSPVWMDGLSADLKVDCLAVGNPNTDFINYEMWMLTNRNVANSKTWIEQGMTAGTLATAGNPVGFMWYWADQRSLYGQPWNYFEHYIGPAHTNQSVDAGLIWRPGTGDWDIWHDHKYIGGSIGVGAYAGVGQTGIEMTDLNTAAIGTSTSFRYKQPGTGNYLWAPKQSFYNNKPTHLSGNTNGATVNAQTTSNCWPGTTSAKTAPKMLTADVSSEIAKESAANLGESAPRNARQVTTTRAEANKLIGAQAGDSAPAVVTVMDGSFRITKKLGTARSRSRATHSPR
ncbi:hypothetical protein P9209_17470 [Prescottella defluvii]|nr:hypothetical protein P9209_17470 [Prescottella defluvii]